MQYFVNFVVKTGNKMQETTIFEEQPEKESGKIIEDKLSKMHPCYHKYHSFSSCILSTIE